MKLSPPSIFIYKNRLALCLLVFMFVLLLTGSCTETNTPASNNNVVNPLATIIPLSDDLPLALAAGIPSTTSTYFELPGSFDWGKLAEASIDPAATLSNLAIVRTDGGTSPDPTVEMVLQVADGDTGGSCAGGVQAFRFEVTGNEDFSSTSVTEDEGVLPQSALDIINSGSFTSCSSITSSVDASIMLTGLSATFGFNEDCAAPQDISGVWSGEYSCENVCGGETYTEGGPLDITVIQSGGTAIYWDDYAVYIGSVCGSSFNHLGAGPGYYEYGTFTRTGESTATKSSTWFDTPSDGCSGTCSDTYNMHAPLD
jgi:hypothetical protein